MESLPLPIMSKLVPELVPFLEMKDVSRSPPIKLHPQVNYRPAMEEANLGNSELR